MADTHTPIAFKRGLHANLPTAIGGAQDGVFYLTTDTNRLYVGIGTNLVDLNKYIKIVADTAELNALPHVNTGDFAYISNGNILAVYTGSAWQQINANTDNDTYISGITASTSKDSTAKKLTVTLNVAQTLKKTDGTTVAAATVPVSFDITQDDFNALVEGAEVDVTVESVTGGVKVKTSGTGSSVATDAGFEIVGSDNVTIAKDASSDKITISAKDTTYTLEAGSDNSIGLTGGGTTDSVKFAAGQNLEVSTANETITFKHVTVDTEEKTSTAAPAHKGTFTVIDDIDVSNGHVTKINTKTITLPEDKDTTYTIESVSADANGKINVALKGSGGNSVTTSSDADLYIEVNGQKVYNQGSIEFYTKSEIDAELNKLDAMTYRGVVNATTPLPSSGVKVGDTYKVAAAGQYGDHDCEVGDILIATGTETNGVITSGLEWTYVPSGDDTDTQYLLTVANNVVTLFNDTKDTSSGTVEFKSGEDIVIDTTTGAINVAHKEYSDLSVGDSAAASPAAGEKVSVVGKVVTSNGHVTAVETKEITLPADTTYTIGANNNVITLDGSSGTDSQVEIVAGNDINVSTASNKITVKHEDFTTTKSNDTAATDTNPTYGGSFEVVSGVVTDNGHITGYKVKSITLPASDNTTYTVAGATTVTDNIATYTTTLTGSSGGSTTSAVAVSTNSLTMAKTAAGYSIDLEWGSF